MSTRSRVLGRLALAIGVPLGLLLLAEVVARLVPEDEPPGIWHDPYFRSLHHANEDGSVGAAVVDGEGRPLWSNDRAMAVYASQAGVGRRFAPRAKADGTVRVFCFGGSSTYGLPWAPHMSFARLLEARLGRLLPDRSIEVINSGISGYDSHDLPLVARESLAFAPDVWIVYAGHNELKYPNLSRIKSPFVSALLERSSLVRRLVPPASAPPVPGLIEFEAFLTEAEFERSLQRYRHALEGIVELGRRNDVEVVLCTPASNVRDKEPRLTVLSKGSVEEREARRQKLQFLRGIYAPRLRPGPVADLDPTRFSGDRAELQAILAAEPDAALAHFLSARLDLLLGETERARESFRRSRECDGLPERATPAMVDSVRMLAEELDVPLADTAAHLVDHARSVEPGQDLFVDYCHPLVEGHWWLADAILSALAEHEVIAGFTALDPSREPPPGDRLAAYLDDLDFDEQTVVRGKIEGAMARIGQALEQTARREELLAIAEEWLLGALRMDSGSDPAEAQLLLGVVAAMRGEREPAWRWIERGQAQSRSVATELAGKVVAHPLLLQTLQAAGIEVDENGFQRAERQP